MERIASIGLSVALCVGCGPESAGAGADGGGRDARSTPSDGAPNDRDARPSPLDAHTPHADGGPGEGWVNVTPADMDTGEYGPGYIRADPDRPGEMYVGAGSGGLWKSTDYGLTWRRISETTGHFTLALAPGTPGPTFYTAPGDASGRALKSVDGGLTWTTVGEGGLVADLYSIVVDPYDPQHLLSGLHESHGLYESVDGGDHWRSIAIPEGGSSWYPFFLDTGDPSSTRRTWLMLTQEVGSSVGTQRTDDGGATWTEVSGNRHMHGACQIYQPGAPVIFMAGSEGIQRSEDLGLTWSVVDSARQSVVWGTPFNVYGTYSWATGGSDPPNFQVASQPGTAWTSVATPPSMDHGATSVAVVNDGTHYIFVGVMWRAGIWRYVEP